MPIRREYRRFYGRAWRKVVRPRILKRAENRCEFCRVPNHALVTRAAGWWDKGVGFWHDEKGRRRSTGCLPTSRLRRIRVVLTVAHLNHTPGDDRHENLRALCQWCHLALDKNHHYETRAARKDAARPLLLQETKENNETSA